ncbi:MAG: hypothetical protein ACRDU4_05575 [Mycobacterium sp.]
MTCTNACCRRIRVRFSPRPDTLAALFDCGRSTMRRALQRTGQLLDEQGIIIEPVTLPVPSTDLTTKIKTAC